MVYSLSKWAYIPDIPRPCWRLERIRILEKKAISERRAACRYLHEISIEYHELSLNIDKEVGNKAGEGKNYGNLGNVYDGLGLFQTAIKYHELSLNIVKEVGDKDGEGKSYCNLGNAYDGLGQFKTAIEYHELSLNIDKEVGNKAGEGKSYCSLGNAYQGLRQFQTAIEYYELALNIAKEVGSKAGEGMINCNLGLSNLCLGYSETAVEYFVRASNITKEVGDKFSAAKSLHGLGASLYTRGNLHETFNCFHSSLHKLHEIRAGFQSKEEWTISFRNSNVDVYTSLSQLHLELDEVVPALHIAEQGRAEALRNLLELKYGYEEQYQSSSPQKSASLPLSCLLPNTIFTAVYNGSIFYWVIQNGKEVTLREKPINNYISKEEVTIFIETVLGKLGIKVKVKDEDRSYLEACDKR
ncbi:G-protein-signaling modulator 2-like, partial [Stylophora pistillata]|uniref:G-protein-signaling modulator 2-like n=1 Tax=Stylophora pistillata TaxID=50429 RepID=UPI000C044C10